MKQKTSEYHLENSKNIARYIKYAYIDKKPVMYSKEADWRDAISGVTERVGDFVGDVNWQEVLPYIVGGVAMGLPISMLFGGGPVRGMIGGGLAGLAGGVAQPYIRDYLSNYISDTARPAAENVIRESVRPEIDRATEEGRRHADELMEEVGTQVDQLQEDLPGMGEEAGKGLMRGIFGPLIPENVGGWRWPWKRDSWPSFDWGRSDNQIGEEEARGQDTMPRR